MDFKIIWEIIKLDEVRAEAAPLSDQDTEA